LESTPYNNGTTHVVFEQLDFLARLAALVPGPRVNLRRYHGVFASGAGDHILAVQGTLCQGRSTKASRAPRGDALGTALKRVFGIDVDTCAHCSGTLRIIASIEDPVVIKAILAHLANKARPVRAPRLPPGRASPAPVFS
jgi:hypothetical protein